MATVTAAIITVIYHAHGGDHRVQREDHVEDDDLDQDAGEGRLDPGTAVALLALNLLGGRDRQRLEALEEEVETRGGRALVVGTHLAKRHHPAHLVEAAVEAFGGLDVLLFMARASAPPLRSLDLDAWEDSVDVNVKGFLYSLAAALPVMLERRGGRVLLFASDDPEEPDPLYVASQAATDVILGELNTEFSAAGVRAERVRAQGSERANPEACAEKIRDLLTRPPD
jgi:NADP-dependent 3-hydroxy acid dehydrogenase YdfG